MGIEEKFEGVEKFKTAACFVGGKYHYRTSKDDKDRQYCSLSEFLCPYYQLVKGKDLCTAYNVNNK